MILVEEAYNNGWISRELYEIIPDGCPICGSELYLTDNLTQLFCNNKFCPGKVANRIEWMLKILKVDEWGFQTALNICIQANLKSPFELLDDIDDLLGELTPSLRQKIDAVRSKRGLELELWEFVRLAGLPGIDSQAFKLFGGYSNLDDFYRDLDEQGIYFIVNRLGLGNEGVLAVRIYNTLQEYKLELYYGIQFFNIKRDDRKVFEIAITGPVNNFESKQAFVEYVNSLLRNLKVVMGNTVTKKTKVLVNDFESNSNKLKKARSMQEKGIDIKIMNSIEFMSYIKMLDAEEGNKL